MHLRREGGLSVLYRLGLKSVDDGEGLSLPRSVVQRSGQAPNARLSAGIRARVAGTRPSRLGEGESLPDHVLPSSLHDGRRRVIAADPLPPVSLQD